MTEKNMIRIRENMEFIFSADQLQRIRLYSDEVGKMKIQVDVHGMSCCEARRFMNNLINTIGFDCSITVIHGYNHGTAIRDMLENQFDNCHVRNRQPDPFNPGRTFLSIA